ncbi:MAG: M3 family oligoendopeptidase [Anaerolineales bacterium]|nr:M3 family oligoendopeptidase [Anaerolineales bacterium]
MSSEKDLGTLPHWDLSNIYPSLESKEVDGAVEDLRVRIKQLDQFLEKEKISRTGDIPSSIERTAKLVSEYLQMTNDILALVGTIEAFLYGYISTDSFNTLAKRRESELERITVRINRQEVLFKGWFGEVIKQGTDLGSLHAANPAVNDHDFFLQETVKQSRYLMSEEEEALASELSLSGASAWQKLQGTVTSQISVPFEREGIVEDVPIAALQNIRKYDPDEQTRRRAFEAEIAAWESMREPLAACMNGVKGTVLTLNERRGREDALHAVLDQTRMDRETLQTMLGVMKGSFPAFRRYYKAKAKRIGKEALAWWDLFAPVGGSERRFTFDEARIFIVDNFCSFSPHLAEFTQKAFDQGWIDAEPRKGKRGGAFCMDIPLVEESRILANYDGSFDQLSTLAHELGHAFHNECQWGLAELQRITPMTLAETASIFNETLIGESALAQAQSIEEELSILETFLVGTSGVIVDIYSRYLFETEVFEKRSNAELSADDFCEIMLRCQAETFADGLDEQYRHPYMWAWKPHYYSPSRSFYNFPYAFGQLFGMGLFALYQERGEAFLPDYESLLRSTGMGNAAELAARFDIDLRSPAFWKGSMEVIEGRVERYLELTE